MRWGGAGVIAAVLMLAGCKSTAPKPTDKKDLPTTAAARTKAKGPAWLDESMAKLPGAAAETGVPKAGSWADPKDPAFNVAAESRGLLAGKVLDPSGNGAKGVFVRIEPVDISAKDKVGAAIGILTDSAGYFMAKDVPHGRVYNLVAEAKIDGKPLFGVVQTRPPQPNITIALRDDVVLPPTGLPPTAQSGPQAPLANGALPPPSPDLIPPMGLVPGSIPGAVPGLPADGAWAPGAGAAASPIPATIAPAQTNPLPTSTPTLVPVPTGSRPATSRPENVADGPASTFRPPAASIPGPVPIPQFPSLPPATTPALPVIPPLEKKVARPVRAGANFALIDALERPWDFSSSRYGSLVLIDFMTTTCVPCRKAVPTLIDLQTRYAGDGLQLIGVVCDDVPQKERAALAAKYQREHNLNYLLYVEPGPESGSVRDRFQVVEYPTVVLLDGAGTAVWKGHPGNRAALESAIRQQLGK